MAEFWVKHSLNPHKAVKFNITLRYFVVTGERGEHVWVLEVGTTHLDANGDPISAKFAHNISAGNFDEIIEDAVAILCNQIDWSPFVRDVEIPHISGVSPTGSGVSMAYDVNFIVADALPSAGIDLSNVKITLDNSMTIFDITNEVQITGDPYQYEFKWVTPLRVYNTYN
jgi:hypothetical protein